MARKPTVNLTDTFETFRQKTNLISSNVGDPDNLTTPVTTDLVQALNEINGRTTQSYIRNSVSLNASNNALHASMSYNAATGVFSFQSNTITDSDIPTLDASKTGTGIFDAQRIPGLDACKIITGVLDSARMPVGYFDKEFLNNTTDDLQEGSTNLYYTDQRVHSAVGIYPGDSTLDYNTGTGQFRVNVPGLISQFPNILDSAQSAAVAQGAIDSAYVAARVPPSGIALTDLSVTTGSASGGGSLAYNNGTGAFTFAPADMSTAGTRVYRQTITIAGGVNGASYQWPSSSFPNGISRKPDVISTKVICTQAAGGFSVGDEIYLPPHFNEPAGDQQGYNISWDNSASKLISTLGDDGISLLQSRTGGKWFYAYVTHWNVVHNLVWYGTDADEDIDTIGSMSTL
jgi:hypothetical protein